MWIYVSMLAWDKAWKRVYLIAVVCIIVAELLQHTMFISMPRTNQATKILLVASCLAIVLKLLVNFFHRSIPIRSLIVMMALVGASLILCYLGKTGIYLILLLIAVGGYDVEFDIIVQVYAIVLICGILITLAFWYLGIIGQTAIGQYRDDKYVLRYSHGFQYYYDASHYTFFAVLAWVYWRKEKITWLEVVLILALDGFVYSFAGTKSPAALTALCLCIVILQKIWPGIRCYWKTYGILATLCYPVCAIVLMLYTAFCKPESAFFLQMNEYVSGRLSLNKNAFVKYGYTLFGNNIVWETSQNNYNLVDSSYLTYQFEYGLIFLIGILIACMIIGIYSARKKDFYYVIVAVLIAVYAMFDNWLLRPECNVFLLAFPYVNSAIRAINSEQGGKCI